MAKRHSTRKNLRTRRSIKGRIGGGNYYDRLFGGKRRTKMKGGFGSFDSMGGASIFSNGVSGGGGGGYGSAMPFMKWHN